MRTLFPTKWREPSSPGPVTWLVDFSFSRLLSGRSPSLLFKKPCSLETWDIQLKSPSLFISFTKFPGLLLILGKHLIYSLFFYPGLLFLFTWVTHAAPWSREFLIFSEPITFHFPHSSSSFLGSHTYQDPSLIALPSAFSLLNLRGCCCSVALSCPTLCDPMDYSLAGSLCPCMASSITNSIDQNSTFSNKDETTLTHHYPKSIAYPRVHSWCRTFHGLGLM